MQPSRGTGALCSSSWCKVLVAIILGMTLGTGCFSSLASAHPQRANLPDTNTSFNTGQHSDAKPVLTFCGAYSYMGWASTESTARLNIAIGTDPTHITNVVTFNEYLYRDLSLSRSTGPALTCWSGRVYVAFTGTDNKLYFGYFDGNPAHNYLQAKVQLSQYSYHSPALAASNDGWINLSWTGTDGRLNVIRSSNGTSWGAVHTWSQTATGGPGFANFCYNGCNPYISWVGTDSGHQLNIGYFATSNGTFVNLQQLGAWHMNSGYGFDASLAVQSGNTLYIGFEVSGGTVNYGDSTNPSGTWYVSLSSGYGGAYGVGTAVDPSNNNVWLSFTSVDPTTNHEVILVTAGL